MAEKFNKISKKENAAEVYLQILALASAASDNIQILPYHEDERSNAVQIRLIVGEKIIDRCIILNQHPTISELMSLLNIIYDLIEIDRGNKPHYQKGSHLTHEELVSADLSNLDNYMEQFERLVPADKVGEFRKKADENLNGRGLQEMVAVALGASRAHKTETVISHPTKK